MCRWSCAPAWRPGWSQSSRCFVSHSASRRASWSAACDSAGCSVRSALVDRDPRSRFDRSGHPAVAANDRAAPDDGVAAEDRGIGVNDDLVFDRGMALLRFGGACLALGQRAPTEGDALIDAHALSDDRRFADDDSGAVIDEEPLADRCTGVDVDAGLLVGVLGDHAGDDAGTLTQEPIGHAVTNDGVEPRVAEDDLVGSGGGGVALVGGLDVRRDGGADVGESSQESRGDVLRRVVTARAVALPIGLHVAAAMVKPAINLLPEPLFEILQSFE